MLVKFWQTIVRFLFFLSYLITTVPKLCRYGRLLTSVFRFECLLFSIYDITLSLIFMVSRLKYTFAKKINRTRYISAWTVLSCRVIVPLWLTPLNFESNIFGLTKCCNEKLAERFKKIVWIIGIFQATFCLRNLH